MGGPGAKRLRQRGAALLDLIAGAAVALIVFGAAVTVVHALGSAAQSRHAIVLARTQADEILERMRAEAASAWSVFVPAADVGGASNADGHEIDFATQDAARSVFRWAYSYDRSAQTLTRYALSSGGTAQAQDTLSGVTAFSAQAFPATSIADPASAVYDPLFANATVTPVAYTLADGSVAGNGFVRVAIAGAGTSETALLSTGIAPTQFTVVVRYTPQP